MRVRWSDRATKQLAEAYEFVLLDNPAAADRQLEMILRSVDQLANFPKLGRPGRLKDTRELVIAGTPYVVAYSLTDRDVQILALLHGARRWPEHF